MGALSQSYDTPFQRHRPPHPLLSVAEIPRAVLEASLLPWTRRLLTRAPRGDGHPILVLPGFTASDVSTRVLRRYLNRLGHAAHPWELGRNLGPVGDFDERIHRRVEDLAGRTGQRVSLIGWSLGGIYAREVARSNPDAIRQVITLGSPFAGAGHGTNVVWIYDAVTGERIRLRGHDFLSRMKEPPPVPSTAIFSKSDGVAAWQTCIEDESLTTDNIEIVGSHCGLGFNPTVLYAIADRLALAEGQWAPFDRSGWRRFLYR